MRSLISASLDPTWERPRSWHTARSVLGPRLSVRVLGVYGPIFWPGCRPRFPFEAPPLPALLDLLILWRA